MKVFNLEIISPEGRIYKDIVTEVILPTTSGEITVLPNHAPLFTKISEGEMTIIKENEKSFITISGGFLEISENKVNVLADYAIRSDKIEEEKILEAKKKAEEERLAKIEASKTDEQKKAEAEAKTKAEAKADANTDIYN